MKRNDWLAILFVIVIMAIWACALQTAVADARDTQHGLQVQLIKVEGMTCVAVFAPAPDSDYEFEDVAGVSCDWNGYKPEVDDGMDWR